MRNCGRGFTLLRRKADPRRSGFFVSDSLLIISDGESVPSGKIHPEAGRRSPTKPCGFVLRLRRSGLLRRPGERLGFPLLRRSIGDKIPTEITVDKAGNIGYNFVV